MDWRDFSKKLLLADGKIDAAEARLLQRSVLADGVVEQDEIRFMLELKREARSVSTDFNLFLQSVIRRAVLKDGSIDADEVVWLRKLVFEDRMADADEMEFLKLLGREAKRVCREYVHLLEECDAAGISITAAHALPIRV